MLKLLLGLKKLKQENSLMQQQKIVEMLGTMLYKKETQLQQKIEEQLSQDYRLKMLLVA
jgi:hypothetical protein